MTFKHNFKMNKWDLILRVDFAVFITMREGRPILMYKLITLGYFRIDKQLNRNQCVNLMLKVNIFNIMKVYFLKYGAALDIR